MKKIDLEKIGKRLQELEYDLSIDWGLKGLSGGFVNLEYVSHDDRFIYISCRSGVQNDVDNDVLEEDMRMNYNYDLI